MDFVGLIIKFMYYFQVLRHNDAQRFASRRWLGLEIPKHTVKHRNHKYKQINQLNPMPNYCLLAVSSWTDFKDKN